MGDDLVTWPQVIRVDRIAATPPLSPKLRELLTVGFHGIIFGLKQFLALRIFRRTEYYFWYPDLFSNFHLNLKKRAIRIVFRGRSQIFILIICTQANVRSKCSVLWILCNPILLLVLSVTGTIQVTSRLERLILTQLWQGTEGRFAIRKGQKRRGVLCDQFSSSFLISTPSSASWKKVVKISSGTFLFVVKI